jgi:uncharacterized protein YjiK
VHTECYYEACGSSGVILSNSMYLLLALLLGAGAVGCADAQSSAPGALGHYDLAGAPTGRVELPAELAEVSGLAYTADGRLLAHGDEQAVVFQVDATSGKAIKRFGIGGPGGPLAGDFEDIQVVGDRLFLVTSAGEIIEAKEGRDGETVPVVRRTRGLGGACEVEGMSWDEGSGSMLLLCKQTKGKRWKGQVVILSVSAETGEFEPEPRLLVAESELRRVTGSKSFGGSALVRHPRTGTYLMVAGPQRAYAEIDSSGNVLGGGALPAERHPQPEGLAIAPDLTLHISDEAAKGTAAITSYAYRP